MPITVELNLSPEQAADNAEIKKQAAKVACLSENEIAHVHFLRKSLDARKPQIVVLLKVEIYLKEEVYAPVRKTFLSQPLSNAKTCHIIGMGSAGMYAALQLLERGIKPIILERGKPSRDRIKDLSLLNKKRIVNPESNYCFGEGGAGTYSDGKLYTRSSKRGDIKKVLDVFIQHGADERIGYEAHPHIGTFRLVTMVESMRASIEACRRRSSRARFWRRSTRERIASWR